MRRVDLTWVEVAHASAVGLERHVDSRVKGLEHRPGNGRQRRIEDDIRGACGEAALAKSLGLYWPATVGVDRHLPDVPPGWQVKTSRYRDAELYVRRDDDPAQRFALVICEEPPTFWLVGWILAADAQRVPLTDPYGGQPLRHWIAQPALEPFE